MISKINTEKKRFKKIVYTLTLLGSLLLVGCGGFGDLLGVMIFGPCARPQPLTSEVTQNLTKAQEYLTRDEQEINLITSVWKTFSCYSPDCGKCILVYAYVSEKGDKKKLHEFTLSKVWVIRNNEVWAPDFKPDNSYGSGPSWPASNEEGHLPVTVMALVQDKQGNEFFLKKEHINIEAE